MGGQEGKSKVGIGKIVSLEQPAQTNLDLGLHELDKVEPEAVFGEHLHGAVLNVTARTREVANTTIADMFDPGGIVEEFENELVVVEREWAQG